MSELATFAIRREEVIRNFISTQNKDETYISHESDIQLIDSSLDSIAIILNGMGMSEKRIEAAVSQKIPRFYIVTNILTSFLFIAGIAAMILDFSLSITQLGASVYLLFCLCCVSLFVTNHVAEKEWKENNRKKWLRNH